MCGNFFSPSSPSFLGGNNPIVRTGVEVGLGAIGQPELAAAYGATTGYTSGGGLTGAVTGGFSGYGAASLGDSVATNGIGGTVDNIWSGISNGASNVSDWASNLFSGTSSYSSALPTGSPLDMTGAGTFGSTGDPTTDLLRKQQSLWGATDMGLGGGPVSSLYGAPSTYTGGGFTPPGTPGAGGTGGRSLSSLSSVGSGLYGLYNANSMRNLATSAMNRADPWGTSGGRGVADAQLQSLLNDPTQAAANDPAYQLRIQAAQRATAGSGQGSGAMAVAAANASSDWYNTRLSQLGGISGATVNPGTAADLSLTGTNNANMLAGSSLASIGFGLNTATGGGATSSMSPQVLAYLRSIGAM